MAHRKWRFVVYWALWALSRRFGRPLREFDADVSLAFCEFYMMCRISKVSK